MRGGAPRRSKNSKKTKRVKFDGKSKAQAKVDDLGVGSNATLGTYMTLPAEQWVTLVRPAPIQHKTPVSSQCTDLLCRPEPCAG
jgi:hypothetical protein